jgi:hypothetical protein
MTVVPFVIEVVRARVRNHVRCAESKLRQTRRDVRVSTLGLNHIKIAINVSMYTMIQSG